MNRFRFFVVVAAMAAITFTLGTDAALASTGDPTTPWAPLNSLTGMLTGTPAKVISIIAIVVAGIALIFGEDLGAFAKRLLMVVIATAMIMGSASIIGSLGFKSGTEPAYAADQNASGALIEAPKQ